MHYTTCNPLNTAIRIFAIRLTICIHLCNERLYWQILNGIYHPLLYFCCNSLYMSHDQTSVASSNKEHLNSQRDKTVGKSTEYITRCGRKVMRPIFYLPKFLFFQKSMLSASKQFLWATIHRWRRFGSRAGSIQPVWSSACPSHSFRCYLKSRNDVLWGYF